MRRMLLAIPLVCHCLAAQDPKEGIPGPCSEAGVAELAGAWTKRPDNLGELGRARLSPAERARLVAKAEAAAAVVRKAYPDPKGVTAWQYLWAARVPDAPSWMPVVVSANSLFFKFNCHGDYRGSGRPMTLREPATDAWITVDLNTFDQGIGGSALTGGYELPDGRPIFRNPVRLEGGFRGMPVVEGFPRKDVTVVFVSRQNRLPVRPVTKEEILRVHESYWRKKQAELVREMEAAVARHPSESARHKRMERETDQEWERRNASFHKAQESQVRTLAERRALQERIPGRIEAQVSAMSAGERRAPAAISFINKDQYEDLRWTPVSAGGVPLITWDEAFFDKSLSRGAVHYLSVFWRRVPSQTAKERAYDEILARLDFEALRALLD